MSVKEPGRFEWTTQIQKANAKVTLPPKLNLFSFNSSHLHLKHEFSLLNPDVGLFETVSLGANENRL